MSQAAPPQHCLNCGAPLSGDYCSACGQSVADFRLSFRDMVVDFIDSQFNLNSKLLTSIRLLLIRPGFLTVEYNAGKRVRYVSPLRLYLTASAIFFVFATLNLGDTSPDVEAQAGPVTLALEFAPENDMGQVPTWLTDPNQPLGQFIATRNARIHSLGERNFAELLDQGIWGNVPKMLFILLPVFALLLRFLYRHIPVLYIEHLNFALHYHAVVFVVFGVLKGLSFVTPAALVFSEDFVVPISLLALQVYLVRALYVVYGQSWRRSIAKYFILVTTYTTLLVVALTLTALITYFSV